MNILLATNNPHKAEELAAILGAFDSISLLTLKDIPQEIPEPVEDGDTLEANAYIKAREIFLATGMPTIADDTGLEVTALNGEPGVRSARYAGENVTYDDNCTKLLGALSDTGDRTARFRTVICYTDQFRTLFAEGSIEGTIERERKGDGGFGYDPIFRPAEGDRTFAEMSADEKNAISHRGRALRNLSETLGVYMADMTEVSNG
jgi:XTP/dITP diphosphohydrolase